MSTGTSEALYSKAKVFGRLLKFWRSVHNVTQESLALEIDSSTRHIARLENGDARPTENMIHRIASFFPLGRRDTNNLLLAAGYASMPGDTDLQTPEKSVRLQEILRLMRAMDPYPTVLVNIVGETRLINRAWAGLLRNHPTPRFNSKASNMLDFLLSCGEIQPEDSDWLDRIGVIFLSIQQSLIYLDNPELEEEFQTLLNSPLLPENWQQQAASVSSGLPWDVHFLVNGSPHPFFSFSRTVEISGPLSFRPVPGLIALTMFPRDDDLDLSELVDPDVKHELLLY